MSAPRERVMVTREVRVTLVPDGSPAELPPGTLAQITQALGASFTLLVEGQLMRLAGVDADAIGKPVPLAPVLPADVSPESLRGLVWQTLKTCYDPEIPVDIVELGLVYICDVLPMEGGEFRIVIKMTLTAPGCGMGEMLVEEIHEKLLALPRVGEVDVEFVFDPPWDKSRMSDAALLTLGL
ncbi:putative Fe-S cluster assembly protein SufT [Hydrogenophaga crassostreae]|uniref:Fe-S cluster assembly protein SufT n=1 Tax=Hydrogenophaga crassostreae TaxID=1763535 RepID=A0A162Z404_9BURK|nr:putative Fe-S cluster assembly protein SufT [Hydrogenophaga crassostreae]AOW14422.1 putative Fe-S cluster assembly protein SufT [Hydrogenophaga crassostreae]OAD43553.1 putative Fe-S cluster assembly protein SufT [Hydrogenophaga crassostreae]